ncbi:MAG: HGGxSTG domain-containing protein [Methylobacter sp.]
MANQCGAKTRAGGKCKAPSMKNGRCRVHGGSSTGPIKPNTKNNAIKPGSLYSQYLTDDEQAVFDQIELGKVDDELRLCRVRLARALALEKDHPELSEETQREGLPIEQKFKQRDYCGLIDKLMARIESLEKTRRELLKTPEEDEGELPESKTFTFTEIDGRADADKTAGGIHQATE